MKNLDKDEAQWGMQALARVAAIYGIGIGSLIIAGGQPRWSGRSFAVAMSVPGAPASWGWFVLICGLFALFTTFLTDLKKYTAAGLGLIGLWAFFFGFSFTVSAINDPKAATTGPPTYLALAIGMFIVAVIYYRSGKKLGARHGTPSD